MIVLVPNDRIFVAANDATSDFAIETGAELCADLFAAVEVEIARTIVVVERKSPVVMTHDGELADGNLEFANLHEIAATSDEFVDDVAVPMVDSAVFHRDASVVHLAEAVEDDVAEAAHTRDVERSDRHRTFVNVTARPHEEHLVVDEKCARFRCNVVYSTESFEIQRMLVEDEVARCRQKPSRSVFSYAEYFETVRRRRRLRPHRDDVLDPIEASA